MLDLTTLRGRIIAAALRLAEARSWRDIALADIAEAAGTDLVALRKEFGSKSEIVAAFTRAIDDEVLAKAPKRVPGQAARDAIFDVVMSRFDVLAPYRSALKSITAVPMADPAVIKAGLASQAWMLQAAGVDTEGPRGAVRVAGLASVYGSVFRTWLEDDDPGLARTMAVLDRRLRRGERMLTTLDDMTATCRRIASLFTSGGWRTDRTTRTPPGGPTSGEPDTPPSPSI